MDKAESDTLKKYVEDLQHISDQVGMSEWERNFLQSMSERRTMLSLSPNQITKILDLVGKYGV